MDYALLSWGTKHMETRPVLGNDLRRNRESSGSKLGGGSLSNDRNTKYVATAPHEKAGLKKYPRPVRNSTAPALTDRPYKA